MPKFYTALGWVVWRVAKRQLRKKAAEKVPARRKFAKFALITCLVGGATLAGRRALRSGEPA